MKRLITWLVLLVFTVMIPTPAYAGSRSSGSRSSHRSSVSRPSSRPSPPASRPAPTPPPVKPSTPPPTPRPTAQAAPKPAAKKVSWQQNKKYGTGKSQKAGKRPLKSRTPKPEPHTYNGRSYNSSDAIYTNTSGNWVMYFVLGALVGNAVSNDKEVHCFDEQHKEIKCDRDDNSYQKDW